MVRIRLRRIGLKGQPTYRIVAAEKEAPRDGRFLEILGFYNPRTHPSTIHVKEDRLFHWMKNGALPTESVEQLFRTAGIQDRFERFKKGEPIETLLQEAEEAETKRGASTKTGK
jgi:small subunit ribosomal protein S16